MTLLRSFWKSPVDAAINDVKEPIIVIIKSVVCVFSNKLEQRMIKKTPATTKVAACISADTGVGPSIASGNQICKGIWADLPKTPQKISNEMTVITWKLIPKKVKHFPNEQGIRAKVKL